MIFENFSFNGEHQPVTGNDHLGIHSAPLRAAQAGIGPGNRFKLLENDDLAGYTSALGKIPYSQRYKLLIYFRAYQTSPS